MGGHIFNIPGYNSYNKLPESWQEVIEALNRGTAERQMPIGTQLVDTWRTYQAPWDVVHHFSNFEGGRAVALNWHYCTPDGEVFDEPEAIYYDASGHPAGTYHILIGAAYGNGWHSGDGIEFTLTNAIPAGAQICIGMATSSDTDPANGRTLTVYAAKGSNTVVETTITSKGTGGTLLGSTSSAGTGRTNGAVNSPQRIVYGYNRWSQSAKRQWLNATGAKGTWWLPQNDWDRPPAYAATMDGFLHDCTPEFLAVLQPVTVTTALNTIEGLTETYETTQDRIFLPSLQEMYISPQLSGVEGVDWDYNKALAEEAGLSGRFAQYGTYEILKKYRIDARFSAAYVFLRSAYRGDAYCVWFVTSSGGVYANSACHAYRECPACILKSQ